jgi:transcriptional regulator with PAS, ATPase and Fis domain
VLIQGESGTGKELTARAIHLASPRKGRRWCAVNCAAFADDLVEAELFGHTRGAFTGAAAERAGLFEEADGGTLFLDEISELSPRAQAKLLRVVQEGEVRRIGENAHRRVDVRILAASNRPLADECRRGRFREDLLYRLDVVRIGVPPLRARPEDIPLLVERFWRDTCERAGSRAVLSAAVVAALARHGWPGNVRELQNTLAALAVRAPRSGRLSVDDLDGVLPMTPPDPAIGHETLEAARRRFESRYVTAALARAGGRRSRAAAELGVTRQGLAKLIDRLGLTDSERATV